MSMPLGRRKMLVQMGFAVGGGVMAGIAPSPSTLSYELDGSEPFRYCFNTSTIRGQGLPITDVIDIAAKAGYVGIEPWIDEIERYMQSGGSLRDLAKRIRDNGLMVESAIGFAEWIVDDEARRAKGLEQARRDMDLVAQLGGRRIAAPPAGATDQAELNLLAAAERYRALLELGERMGVEPQIEVWGFSKCLHRLGQAVLVAVESGHPRAGILADVYHLYKGGSDIQGLKVLNGAALHVFHVNDYPAHPPRETITDADRVYPGDGIAPLGKLFRDLRDIGFTGALSLELFNETYYKQDPFTVAKTGLEKLRAVVRESLAE